MHPLSGPALLLVKGAVVRTVAGRGARTPVATPAQVLLRRRGTVYVPEVSRDEANPAAVPGVELLEADLLERGWLVAPALWQALARLDAAELVNVGTGLLADCDALLGADRPHVPLFRNFPTSTPRDTGALYVDRVVAFLAQAPGQPCVLCGGEGTVRPVSPCGHLVCTACFDGADYSGCPICHRRIDVDDPFLKPGVERPLRTGTALPSRARTLHLGVDAAADARAELLGLLARPTALSPADVDDLALLLTTQSRDDLVWVPARVPGRETKARLLAWLLDDPLPAAAVAHAEALVDTATDLLRLLVVRSGGDPSLIARPRFTAVSRPLRRTCRCWTGSRSGRRSRTCGATAVPGSRRARSSTRGSTQRGSRMRRWRSRRYGAATCPGSPSWRGRAPESTLPCATVGSRSARGGGRSRRHWRAATRPLPAPNSCSVRVSSSVGSTTCFASPAPVSSSNS